MQTARVLKMVDDRTGDITLRGVGGDRLRQASASGLVAEELRADYEAVTRANAKLRRDIRRQQAAASRFREQRLNEYEIEYETRAWGYLALGVAIGASIVGISVAVMIV